MLPRRRNKRGRGNHVAPRAIERTEQPNVRPVIFAPQIQFGRRVELVLAQGVRRVLLIPTGNVPSIDQNILHALPPAGEEKVVKNPEQSTSNPDPVENDDDCLPLEEKEFDFQ